MSKRREGADAHLPPGITRTPSNKYLARFVSDGTKRSKTFTNLREATVWKAEQERAIRRGEYVDPKDGRQKFDDLWGKFLASRQPREMTPAFDRDQSYGRSLIIPYLGRLQIARINEVVIQDWVKRLTEAGKAQTTVEKALQLVFAALRFSVDHKGLAKVPLRRLINVPKGRPPNPARFLSAEELGQLIGEFDDYYKALVFTAGSTGLRWGELAGLRAKDVNLAEGHLTVNTALKEVNGRFHLVEPKYGSRRTIHLPADLVEVLRGSLAAIGEGHVFTQRNGQFLRRSNFRRRIWLPAVDASVSRPMRFHDLRHTHAALLIANNENPKIIQERLGHKDISTTLNVYGHLMPGLGKGAADRLNETLVTVRRHFEGTKPDSNVTELKLKR